jgi:nucleotide-binding universal stress UspA family protein
MGSIVCATRGGEGSRAVQLAAIELAKQEERPLIFLYIADPNSLDEDTDPALRQALREELNFMGETLLRIAQHRADAAFLPSEVIIREGSVRAEIERYVMENDVSLLMLGAPRGTTANVFGDDAIERLAKLIEEDTHIRVRIVRPEERKTGD